ncbi:zinc finger protein 454-like [Anopheles merus]|uniref:zinc finger protein 454-like n=1 Tax=Anopheles merus TaxID=30066 RepID=UPI001BE4DF3C|nr:zinc finger protein 454-like [Anopheles merus]
MDSKMDTNSEPMGSKMAVDWQSYVGDFDRLCRLCLSRERLISIYCNVQGRNVYFIRNFVKFALDLLKIKINKNDALPNFLCEACEKNLNVIVNFKRKCDESIQILHRIREEKAKTNRSEKTDVLPHKSKRKSTTKRVKHNCEEILKKLPQGIRVEKRSANPTQKDVEENTENGVFSADRITSSGATMSAWIEDQNKPEVQNEVAVPEQDRVTEALNDDGKCATFEEEIEFTYTDDNLEEGDNPEEVTIIIQNECPIGNSGATALESKKPVTKEKIACSVCGTSVNNIRSHMIIHSVRSHRCDQCPKSFTSRHKLQSHINGVHLRKRDFKCDICGKAFLENNNLKGHMRIHSGERKYACDLCPKRFLFAGTLRSHMLTHSQEKHHKCEICDKLFLLRTTLNKHLRVHTGEKPHSCSVCEKRFRTTTHLAVHMRTHTGEKPLCCRICGMAFAHHKGRSVHMKAKHPQELVALGLIDDKGHLKCTDTVELVASNAKY